MLTDRMNVSLSAIEWIDESGSWHRAVKALRGDVTDKQFDKLERELAKTHAKLEQLRRKYRRLTGTRWVPKINL